MYRVMVYDTDRGWVPTRLPAHQDYYKVVDLMGRLQRNNPDDQYDIAYTPSKKKQGVRI